jgi:hypothetical protein
MINAALNARIVDSIGTRFNAKTAAMTTSTATNCVDVFFGRL